MSLKLQVNGADKLVAFFTKSISDSQRAVARGTTKAAFILQGAARQKLQKPPKSGALRKRGGKDHRASAPGEAPATDTGNLVRSIKVVAAQPGLFPQALVTVGTEYALALEFGTKRSGRKRNTVIAERPFMRPSVREQSKAMSDAILAEIRGRRK